ncbi:hypothetical protein ACFLVB_03490 [Chloroflexota bacterium]
MQDTELSGQKSNDDPLNEKTTGKAYQQISQSRSSILSAVIILLIVNLLSIVSIFLGEDIETHAFPTTYQIVFSVLIDLFLAINILRGKRWARTWILIRSALGIVIWGIVYTVQGDSASLILNTGVLVALIILLTGTSTRFRQFSGISLAVITIIVGIITSLFEYSSDLPTVPEIVDIPASYSSYVNEGFFSISYPPDWSPQMSIVSKLEEKTKQDLKDMVMDSVVDDYQLVFVGCKYVGDDVLAAVTISVEPKIVVPFATIIEINHARSVEGMKNYTEYSRVKTTIDGKDAIIQTYAVEDSDSYYAGYTNAYISGNKFFWTVSCTCDGGELGSNLDTFEKIVTSLRVEY